MRQPTFENTIHVVGPGVVGKATGEGFRRFGWEVTYTDKGDDHGKVRAYIHFVCTPEDVAPQVARELVQGQKGQPRTVMEAVCIRSSVPPGTCQELSKELGFEVVHNPEFLREAVAEYEFLDAKHAVVGDPWGIPCWQGDRVRTAYELIGKQVLRCSSRESELLKLALNCYLATQISFWNAVQQVAQQYGVNSHGIARMALRDGRVSRYGAVMHGAPYGGRCLPKDVTQMLDISTGAAREFFSGVQAMNDAMSKVGAQNLTPPRPWVWREPGTYQIRSWGTVTRPVGTWWVIG